MTKLTKSLVLYGYWDIPQTDQQWVADHFDLVDFSQGCSKFIQQFDTIKPSIMNLVYADMIGTSPNIDNDGLWTPKWAEINSHEDWFVHDKNGNRIQSASWGWYAMDPASGWRDYFATQICKYLLDTYPAYDGIFADDCWTYFPCEGFTWNPWSTDLSNIPASINDRWATDTKAMLAHIKSVIGAKKLLPNQSGRDITYLDYCDGVHLEGNIHPSWYPASQNISASDILQNIDYASQITAKGKLAMFDNSLVYADPYNPTAQELADTQRILLWSLCSAFIANQGNTAFFFSSYNSYAKGYYPEMEYDPGNPLGEKYSPATDCLARDFTNARLMINTGDSVRAFSVGANSYTLQPRSGMIVPTPKISRLHTEGNLIKNDAGQTINLRGISVSDLLTSPWFNGGANEIARRLDTISTTLNGHVITVLQIYIGLGWSGTQFDQMVASVDEAKNYCVAHDMYFTIKADSNGNPTAYVPAEGGNPTLLANWFLFWVQRYTSVPNFVGIDIFNEPWWSTGSQEKWRETVVSVYNIVHATDPSLLIFCPSFPFTSISSDFITNPIGIQTVLTFDFYYKHCNDSRAEYAVNDYTTAKQRLKQIFTSANVFQNTVPVYMTEFGWGDLTYDNSYALEQGWQTLTLAQDLQACRDWFDILNSNGIHWSFYTLWINPHGNNGVCEDTYDNLTDWGKIWAENLNFASTSPTPNMLPFILLGAGIIVYLGVKK